MYFWIIATLLSMSLAWLIVNIAVPTLIVKLANAKITQEGDRWWNPYCVLPPSGEFYVIVRGSPNGPFDRLLESVTDHEYDKNTHLFTPLGDNQKKTPKEGYLAKLGVASVGIYRHLLRREIEHVKYVQIDESKDGSFDRKKRPGPSIFFRWNMATLIHAAEIKGNLSVDAVIVYTAQLTDPVRALFFAGGWEKQVAAAVQGCFRRYSPGKTLEDLLSEKKEEGDQQTVSSQIRGLSTKGPGDTEETGLYPLFGVKIVDARFVKVDVIGSDEARASVQALEIAERKAKAEKAKGEGVRDRRLEEAKGIEATMRAYNAHPDAAQIAMAEAIKEAQPSVIGAGVMVSVDTPSNRKVVIAEK